VPLLLAKLLQLQQKLAMVSNGRPAKEEIWLLT